MAVSFSCKGRFCPSYLLDYLTSNLLLPVCGFALAVFVGWALLARVLTEELHLTHLGSRLLRATLRYIVPTGIAAAALLPLYSKACLDAFRALYFHPPGFHLTFPLDLQHGEAILRTCTDRHE